MMLSETIMKYANDYDLGAYFAANYHSLDDFNEYMGPRILKEYPNYYDLGKYLRNEFVNENPFRK